MSYDSVRPWIGVSPLQRSTLSAELPAGIEQWLRSERERESRYVLPIPADPAPNRGRAGAQRRGRPARGARMWTLPWRRVPARVGATLVNGGLLGPRLLLGQASTNEWMGLRSLLQESASPQGPPNQRLNTREMR